MRKSYYLIILSTIFCSHILFAQIYTESESIIPEIKKGNFDKELVEIEGVVEFWERVPQKTTVRYWLRDYWGKLIPIQSINEHPIVNQKYKIEGTVQISDKRLSYNNTRTRRFIDEHSRIEIGVVIEEPQKPDQPTVESEEIILLKNVKRKLDAKKDNWIYDYSEIQNLITEAEFYIENGKILDAKQNLFNAELKIENPPFSRLLYLSVILIVLVITIVIVLIYLFVGKSKNGNKEENKKPIYREFDQSKLTVKTPQPVDTVGETIKLAVPPQGTLKVLKGRFEIIDGETELKEIRLYSLPNQNAQEFSFGRNAGAPYQHIQIANPTVSRDQARLLHSNGTYSLINKADPISKNATKLNGVDMPLNEAKQIKDGDKITMGVVSMVYREN